MPWRSKRQMRWMYANAPRMAEKWKGETTNIEGLPEKVPPRTERDRRKEALKRELGR